MGSRHTDKHTYIWQGPSILFLVPVASLIKMLLLGENLLP